MFVNLLGSGITAANSAPSADTDGVALWAGKSLSGAGIEGFRDGIDEADILLYQSAYTSGVPAISFARVWGGYRVYTAVNTSSIIWSPLGTGTGNASASTDKGRLNAGAAIDGPSGTTFKHVERVRGLRDLERLALQIGTFTGVWTLQAQLNSRGPQRWV